MSNASSDYARKQTAHSLDTVAVYNPTDVDEVIWVDKSGPQASKTLIPNKEKDIGFGKGVTHLPRFKAKMYAESIIVKLINKVSDKKWAKDSKVYRTRDEKLQHAESEQIRTNDPNFWFQYCPSKKNLDRLVTKETTLDSIIEEEKAYRQAHSINIPIKTLVWLGLVEKFGGAEIADPAEENEVLDHAGFGSPF